MIVLDETEMDSQVFEEWIVKETVKYRFCTEVW